MSLNLSKMNMSKSLGIDLGTSNTLIYLAGKGIVLQEPSVAAVNNRSMQVLDVGDAAGLMVGKTAGEQLAFRPIKDGVIADFDVTVAMLGKFIRKVTGPILLNRPKVAVCVPLGLTGVERRAFEDAAGSAGARSVTLIEAPIAAAIGANIKIGAAALSSTSAAAPPRLPPFRSAASWRPPRCARHPPRWTTRSCSTSSGAIT